MGKSTVELLTQLLAPVAKSLDCELWGLEYSVAGRKRGLLRLYIDKEGGVTLTDCEKISRQVSSVLDVEDPIQTEYVLEVSSPGMVRPLYTVEQFKKYVGAMVRVKLQRPFEGRRQFSGVLSAVVDAEITLMIDDEEFVLPLESIDRANVVPTFDDKSPKGGAKGRKNTKPAK
jgi:ribosome maturation factor RimP